MTKNQREYQRQINRLKRAQARNESHGYIAPDNVIPSMPSRVTKQALAKIKNTKPEDLRRRSQWVDPSTGEIFDKAPSLKEAKKALNALSNEELPKPQPRQKNYTYFTENDLEFPSFSTTVIDNFKSEILRYPEPISDKIIDWVNDLIKEQGEENVAEMLENSSEQLKDYLNDSAYDSNSGVREFTSNLLNHMPDMTDARKADLMEDFETYGGEYDV